ncbi:MAG: ParA family protein [Candidatus Dadabacteria bacterium]|nr:ParA family protein [Candidatus Dadabacteria bacterium]
MRVISVANQKGGVGKTTLSFHLGCYLNKRNKTVLLVDLDSQGNLTKITGVKRADCLIYDVFSDYPVLKTEPIRDGLSICTSDYRFSKLMFNMKTEHQGALKKALAGKSADYAVVDCPSGLNSITASAYIASDFLLIPTLPSDLSVDGIEQFLEIVGSLKTLKVLGIVVNRYIKKRHSSNSIKALLGAGYKIIKPIIPERTAVEEAEKHNLPIWDYAPGTDIAGMYELLMRNIIKSLH